jgi:type IV secretory pathway VirB2 component (pilin)
VTIVGVIYIIYAGFQLMTGGGDEEKLKKTKNIIVYVIIGIIVMWLAYPLMKFIIRLLNLA